MMSNDRVTRGPWEIIQAVNPADGEPEIYVGYRDRREEIQDYSLTHAEEHACKVYGGLRNARLIAAAPEMRKWLERFTADFCPNAAELAKYRATARALLTRIDGGDHASGT